MLSEDYERHLEVKTEVEQVAAVFNERRIVQVYNCISRKIFAGNCHREMVIERFEVRSNVCIQTEVGVSQFETQTEIADRRKQHREFTGSCVACADNWSFGGEKEADLATFSRLALSRFVWRVVVAGELSQ